ncbi:amidase [Sphingobium sp.]|uniref:amidase n=1 Tax=Sphingobium sp. TaxID=1912891 RepID=UPI00260C0527|nr:amidase [Sphingobium sp.]
MIDPHNVLSQKLSLGSGPTTILVKDCIDIAGTPTCQGSGVLADIAPADRNAEVIDRLLADGGWTITGKANMHEFAFGVTGVNGWAGTVVNPRWPDRIAGGSSSGSAAGVASGLADAAIGSDTGGSVRMPAACCGVAGLKPSFGRVSRKGAYPTETSLDCIGVFARSMDLIEDVMAAIAPDWKAVQVPASLRIGLVAATAATPVQAALADGVARLHVCPEACDLPLMDAAFDAGVTIMGAESWAALGQYADHPAMGEDVRGRVKAGAAYGPDDLAKAEAVRADFRAQVDALLTRYDVLLLPTLPDVPPTLEEARDARKCVPLTRLVRPFNLSGHPAVSLPILTPDGLPAGLQIVGRRGGDEALCAAARWIEQALARSE